MITDADAEFDFETASEAGQVWDDHARTWRPPKGAAKRGLPAVNAAAYAEHPTTRVLTLSYDLPPWWRMRRGEAAGKRRWRPGDPLPADLFAYLEEGWPIEAFNVMFERLIWEYVCVPKYGWPSMFAADSPRQYQLRCAMAKARVNGYPGGLGPLSEVLQLPTPKDADGKRLLDKFSVPRKPTKDDPRLWILPPPREGYPNPGDMLAHGGREGRLLLEDAEDFERLRAYCDTDLDAERGASKHPTMAPLSPSELEAWFFDQELNWRGLGVDRPAIRDCIAVLEQALDRYGAECRALTGGIEPTQLQQLIGWLRSRGVYMASMDEAAVTDALARMAPHPPGGYWATRRVLELRQKIGSASVKKLFAMENQATSDNRLRNLLTHHGTRPGRPTGEGPQPLNLPKGGPTLNWCRTCWTPYHAAMQACPWTGCGAPVSHPASKWPEPPLDAPPGTLWPIEFILGMMRHRNLDLIEHYFGEALVCISGCVRGLFVAKDGHDLIASDYNSLQAVVLSMLAGEQWRIEAFQRKQDIYLHSAARITGTPMAEYEAYRAATGAHHPDRGKIGKVNELANGFGGWIGSSRAFGATEDDEVIKARILAWRDASPAIVEFWGGQFRGRPWDRLPVYLPEIRAWDQVIREAQTVDPLAPCFYGVEGAAIQAVQRPGEVFTYRGIDFFMRDDALIIRLLSRFPGDLGRELTYRSPRLSPSTREWSRPGELALSYMAWNTNPTMGPFGWVSTNTYGPKLTENIVMGVEVDIQRHGVGLLRAAGYPMVLTVYDENVAEIPTGTGSVEEFERLMETMPDFAVGWPIRASGGWIGRRYRKA